MGNTRHKKRQQRLQRAASEVAPGTALDVAIVAVTVESLPGIATLHKQVLKIDYGMSFYRQGVGCGNVARVAVWEQQVVGCIYVHIAAGNMHVKSLMTCLPRHKIGERLLRTMLEKAAKDGIAQSSLFVHVGNSAAIALYVKLGYEIAATLPNYYSSSPHLQPPDAHRMICRLLPSRDAPVHRPSPTGPQLGKRDQASGVESPRDGSRAQIAHDLDDDIAWPSLGAVVAV
mmetsp:Transcript_7577/g.17909  ORF Transcript_7577/g.17909 Transcript_7577/m.17909 type:complete len:230 (-) Transcript_7577:41-730(-)